MMSGARHIDPNTHLRFAFPASHTLDYSWLDYSWIVGQQEVIRLLPGCPAHDR
jgi:hypothetical protein